MADLMAMPSRVPELCAGDVLTRDEFERRYSAMPGLKKAELVEGVVYVGSPVRYIHGEPHLAASYWLGGYVARTRGVIGSDNTSVRLDLDNEPQPDLLLALPATAGGTLVRAADGRYEGAPELVVEIAGSSVSYDLHQKLHAYRRNGVAEYVVYRVDDHDVDWFVLERGLYVRQHPDTEGILKSRTFPGLWLSVPALLAGDLAALHEVVARGCATPEHTAFAARLAGSMR